MVPTAGYICLDVFIDTHDNLAPVIIPIHFIKQISMAMKQSEIIEMPVKAQGVAIVVLMNGEQLATPYTIKELADHLGTIMVSDGEFKDAKAIEIPKIVSH